MKHTFLSKLLVAVIVILAFTQCAKDEKSTTPNNNLSLSAFDLKIGSMVSDFKSKLDNKLKSGEIMSLDSALWYINTTANYTYGGADVDGMTPAKITSDSTVVNLPANSGTLTIEQVDALYTTIVDSIRAMYYRVPDSDRKLNSTIIEPANSGGFKSTNDAGTVIVRIVTYSTWGLPGYLQFGQNESYYWKTQTNTGTPVYPNAISKLQDHFALYVKGDPGQVLPPHRVTWINGGVYPCSAQNFAYGSGQQNNYEYYYMFWNFPNYSGYHTYLCGDEMNFYLARLIDLANVKIPQQNGFIVTNTYMCHDVDILGIGIDNTNPIYHSGTFWYGTKVITLINPIDL